MSKIYVIVLVIIALAAFFLLNEKSGVTLTNTNESTDSKILLSDSDQLYVILPDDLVSRSISEISFSLFRKNRPIPTKILSSNPPYHEITNDVDMHKAVILSIDPESFSEGDYSLVVKINNSIEEEYVISLRYEVFGPWSY